MSTRPTASYRKQSIWHVAATAFRRLSAAPRYAFAVPAGAVLPTTSLPPAFTVRQRAVVDAFFGRR